jgi:hypothetical protein
MAVCSTLTIQQQAEGVKRTKAKIGEVSGCLGYANAKLCIKGMALAFRGIALG